MRAKRPDGTYEFWCPRDQMNSEECLGCGSFDAYWDRQSTQYYNDEFNWTLLCRECRARSRDYWTGMWSEYRTMAMKDKYIEGCYHGGQVH